MNIKKILIGIDDSKHAEHAAKYGFDMARAFNAQVGLVNIIEPMMISQDSNDMVMGMPFQGMHETDINLLNLQNEQADNIIERTIKSFAHELNVTHFTEFGFTADGIVKCSKDFNADLVIVGTHSRSGFDRLLQGSVAEHVIRHSDVPVLVVPFPEAAE